MYTCNRTESYGGACSQTCCAQHVSQPGGSSGLPDNILTAMQVSRSVRLTVLSRLAAATLLIWGQCSTETTLHAQHNTAHVGRYPH